jgi:UDP-N-acetylmuramate dehydrogenase
MLIEKQISLKPYNTFNVEASAKYFAKVKTTDELLELLLDDTYKLESKLFIGSGSNILFTKDYDGIVIKIESSEISIISEDNDSVFIQADAGVGWDEFVKYCVDKGFSGVENLSYIPGTVGAAPIQNIGAYGAEVKSVVESVNVILLDSNKEKRFQKSECNFDYRNSIFKNELKGKFVITSVLFKLAKNRKLNLDYAPLKNLFDYKRIDDVSLSDVREAVIAIRKSKLPEPTEIGNAGSFFKNPIISKEKFDELKQSYSDLNGYPEQNRSVKISAAWLIEKCGLKEKRIGNTGVHEKQALVIVNYGDATGKEILEFSKMIQSKVEEKFDIKIINEVNII